MNAEDLMVGDWVKRRNVPNEYLKIIDIIPSRGDGLVKMDLRGLCIIDFISNIEPIELTSEILEQNGYTHDKFFEQVYEQENEKTYGIHEPVAYMISEDHRIILHNTDYLINSNNKWNVHVDTEDMRTMMTDEITYINELQHILNHCKIENSLKI